MYTLTNIVIKLNGSLFSKYDMSTEPSNNLIKDFNYQMLAWYAKTVVAIGCQAQIAPLSSVGDQNDCIKLYWWLQQI